MLRVLVLTALSLLMAAPAFAEGSGGAGGSLGERANWPCQGCNVVTPPGYEHGQPTKLLVTLHGDEGDPDYIQWKLETPARNAGYLMLNLQCPRDLGCGAYEGSWWRWEAYSNQHDIEWLGRQVDAMEAEYNVDLNRIYLAGFSGGSSYLSEYPWIYTMRYAGLVYFAGGYNPGRYGYSCSDAVCKIPAYFLIGTEDFLLPGAGQIRDYLTGCGHEVEWNLVQGEEHGIIDREVPSVFAFLDARPHLCRGDPDPDPEPDPVVVEPEPEPDPVIEPDPEPDVASLEPAVLEGQITCDNLVALEPTALMGKLNVGQLECLEGRIATSPTMTDKDKTSRVLLANAEAKGDKREWERLMRRHLEEIDRSDPNLCFKYALHLSRGGVGRAWGVIKWADYALENKNQWSGATYKSRVYSLYQLKAEAANKLWEDSNAKLVNAQGGEREELASKEEKARGMAKDYAMEWLDYARASNQDTTKPMQLCVAAAGSKKYCQE